MKLTACLSASLIALLASPGSARAATPPPQSNPYSGLDPDGVPLAITEGRDKLTSDQVAALQKNADDITRSHNWLLLDYEQQVQRRDAQAPGQDNTGNVYLQLSLNKDLAKLAGLGTIEPVTPSPEFHAPGPSTTLGMNLRPATSPGSGAFTPLISPLGSSISADATQPFAVSTFSGPLPQPFAPNSSLFSATAPAPAPAPAPESHSRGVVSPVETIDLQTPGMVADKENPLPGGGPELNLDSLPDENGNNTPNANADVPPQLAETPQVMDSDQLHLEIAAKFKPAVPPGAALAAQQQQKQQLSLPAKPTEPQAPEEPAPIVQQPQLSPVHAPIPSPFDMINH